LVDQSLAIVIETLLLKLELGFGLLDPWLVIVLDLLLEEHPYLLDPLVRIYKPVLVCGVLRLIFLFQAVSDHASELLSL